MKLVLNIGIFALFLSLFGFAVYRSEIFRLCSFMCLGIIFIGALLVYLPLEEKE